MKREENIRLFFPLSYNRKTRFIIFFIFVRSGYVGKFDKKKYIKNLEAF